MTENKSKSSGERVKVASLDAPLKGSVDAPLRESVNAPTNTSKGKTVSSSTTAND